MSATATEPATGKATKDKLAEAAEQVSEKVKPLLGEDPDKGKLFEVPRLAVVIDESDPTVLNLGLSGKIELDRTERDQVEFYNRLAAGKSARLTFDVHVAGTKNTHRRDSEGNVDAVVQTKSLICTDVHFA